MINLTFVVTGLMGWDFRLLAAAARLCEGKCGHESQNMHGEEFANTDKQQWLYYSARKYSAKRMPQSKLKGPPARQEGTLLLLFAMTEARSPQTSTGLSD